jgi:hypothetical protein
MLQIGGWGQIVIPMPEALSFAERPQATITVGVNKSSNTLDWFQPDTFKRSKQVKQYAQIYCDNQTDANRQRYKLAKKQLQSNIRANKREANQNYDVYPCAI